MLAELHKQKIISRNSGRGRPRFRLIVNGTCTGVWEKKARKPVRVARPFFLSTVWESITEKISENKKLCLVAAAALLVLVGIIVTASILLQPGPETTAVLPDHDPLFGMTLDEKVYVHMSPDILSRTPTRTIFDITVKTYTVKNNDSLEKIARKMNVDLSTLISFNNISDARSVRKGTVLSIPSKKGIKHVVKPGDSLLKLSNTFNVSMDDLLDWNNLKTTTIYKGQELFIPNARLSSSVVNRVIGQSFIWPTQGNISSPFGWRISPISGKRHIHNGIDIHNVPGTSIFAARAGRVTYISYSKVYGNYIIIQHDEGFQTMYAHLLQVLVKRGQYIRQGEKIAMMGNTGQSTGPHLHFSVYTKAGAVDPMKYLPTKR